MTQSTLIPIIAWRLNDFSRDAGLSLCLDRLFQSALSASFSGKVFTHRTSAAI